MTTKWLAVLLTLVFLEARASECPTIAEDSLLGQQINHEIAEGDRLFYQGSRADALLRYQNAQGLIHQSCGVWSWEQSAVVKRMIVEIGRAHV